MSSYHHHHPAGGLQLNQEKNGRLHRISPPELPPPPPPVPAGAPKALPLGQTHNEKDTKVHYVKLINHEFRSLQLDENLKSKNIFDLIDYCELLYEELSSLVNTEKGLTTYIKGYLIFNYFVNSFIMMHFQGFDQFIESNEQDFIIYLNVFAFYNTDDIIRDDSYVIQLTKLRKWVLEYLSLKSLLSFDVNELYQWLYEYIDYLKQKESIDQSNSNKMVNVPNQKSLDSPFHSNNNDNETLSSFGDEADESVFKFKSRFPSVKLENLPASLDSLPDLSKNSSESSFPPLPDEAPPPLPKHTVNISYDSVSKSVPYPLEPVAKIEQAPYPIEQTSSDDILFSNNNSSDSSLLLNGKRNLYDKSRQQLYPQYDQSIASKHMSLPNPPSVRYSRPPASINSTRVRPPEPLPTQLNVTGSFQNHPYTSNNSHFPSSRSSVQPYSGASTSQHIHSQNYYSNPHAHKVHNIHSSQYYQNPGAIPAHSASFIPNHVKLQQDQIKAQKMHFLKEFSICGLKNFGSSCYINLTIQLLFGLKQLRFIFSNLEYHKYIKDPKFVKLMKLLQNSKDSLLLSEALSGLLKTFTLHGGSSVAPTKFLRIASIIKPDFNIPNEQQDAQEFLLFVLERLHEELSYSYLDQNIDMITMEKIVTKWNININVKDKNEYLNWCQSLIKSEGNSPINDLFQGHLQNKLICNKCGFESINYSPFTILSLPIPNNNMNRIVDLADCLRYYTQDEVLTGENAWNCPKCNKLENQAAPGSALDNHPVFTPKRSGIFRLAKRSKSPAKKANHANGHVPKNPSISTKTLQFIKLPQIMLIHLSRFSMFNLTDKLDTVIQYPLELSFNNNSNNIQHKISYKLVGLINHYGNLKSGHYTSLVNKSNFNQTASNKDNLKHPYWCLFDDDTVRPNLAHGHYNDQSSEFSQVNSKDVYVLCYERV